MLFFISNSSVCQTLEAFALRFGAYIKNSKLTPFKYFYRKRNKETAKRSEQKSGERP